MYIHTPHRKRQGLAMFYKMWQAIVGQPNSLRSSGDNSMV